VDARDLPPSITGLEKYPRATILFRYGDRPIGRSDVTVTQGVISREQLTAALGPAAQWKCHERRVWEMLGWEERPAPAMLPSATVAICTRDRPDDLQRCLEGIAQLLDDGQEVLVIDNCPSNDESQEVVKAFPGVRYQREPRPGLNHARNCALQHANGEIVAFIDDDATPDRNWLRAILLNFDGPNVLCVTGLTMPLEMEAEAQEQFEAYSGFSRGFERRVFNGYYGNPLATGQIGAGANMAVRREILDLVGGFDNALDAGMPTQSGGDHEMFSRILTAGYRIVYEPAALNWHRHRRTYAELRKTIYGYGVGVYSSLLRALLWEREFGVFRIAYWWFRHDQLKNLIRALRKKPGAPLLDLVLAELKGCLDAPFAYRRATRRVREMGGPRNV
jgi:glycosyltransferase involved in cell wall biosynthesis